MEHHLAAIKIQSLFCHMKKMKYGTSFCISFGDTTLTAIMNQSQSEEEAQEWLDYNIMGGINTNLPGLPIIMYSVG